MVSAHDAGIGLAILGVLLLLNPVYLYPHGGPQEKTLQFEAERVGTSDLGDVSILDVADSSVLVCTGTTNRRECLFERRVGTNGSLTVENVTFYRTEDGEMRSYTHYLYVYLDGGFYEPRAEETNGSVVLRLERVNETTVTQTFTTEFEHALPVLQRAIENGSATKTLTVTEPNPREVTLDRLRSATPALVRSGEEYYVVRRVSYESRRFALAKYLSYLQTAAFFVGLGLVVYAFQLPRMATEE